MFRTTPVLLSSSAFEDPRQPAITAEDIQYLRCSVSLILEDTCKTIQNIDDWEVPFSHKRITHTYPKQPKTNKDRETWCENRIST